MKKQFFENEKDGFYGTYYENPGGADCAVIGLFGDDPNDYMAKCGAKWLHKNGVNVLCMSPGKKNYSHVNYPLERIETAIKWLKSNDNRKVGIMGMSTAGMDAVAAASYFEDITLTIGLTASDFVWQGFEQGDRDGCKEWPIPGVSTLSWKGERLPYMPFVYEHPVYWQKVQEETKGSGDFERSTCLFIDSEKARPHTEEEMIKVERIQGKLILVAAVRMMTASGRLENMSAAWRSAWRNIHTPVSVRLLSMNTARTSFCRNPCSGQHFRWD